MKLKRLLTGLDFSLADRSLLAVNAFLCQHLAVQKCYFVHVTDHFVLPQHIKAQFAHLFAPDLPVDELLRQKLQMELLESGISELLPEWEINVLEGKPEPTLLHWIEVKNPDLVLMGNKVEAGSGGVLPRRLARRTPSEVLFIPETFARPIKRIVVAIDFSEYSARALKKALDLAQHITDVQIEALYVVELPPSGFYLNERELSAYNEMVKQTAQKTWESFAQAHAFDHAPLQFSLRDNHYQSTAQAISDAAAEQQADLLILGALGHTAIEVLLFGSVTERVLDYCKDIPIWVVRY